MLQYGAKTCLIRRGISLLGNVLKFTILQCVACKAGVVLGQVNLKKLAILFFNVFDLEVEAAVGGKGGRPTPLPLLIVDRRSPP